MLDMLFHVAGIHEVSCLTSCLMSVIHGMIQCVCVAVHVPISVRVGDHAFGRSVLRTGTLNVGFKESCLL